jgi:hypothetical protein
MLTLGAMAMAGHLLFTAAYAYAQAPAGLLAPVNYLHLVWAAILGGGAGLSPLVCAPVNSGHFHGHRRRGFHRLAGSFVALRADAGCLMIQNNRETP